MPITLLITDDNELLLDTWKYILGFDERFRVVATCTGGEDAVALVQQLRPDIVIMDHDMPGITGIEATILIRNSVPQTKVLGCSLHNEFKYAKKFIEAGASDYIEKTATVKQMADTLLRIYHDDPFAPRPK